MRVTCDKNLIERAKRENCFIVTIAVNGRPIHDDSLCIQRVVDLRTAKKVTEYALALMKAGQAERGQ